MPITLRQAEVQKTNRRMRHPRFPFQVRFRPWEIAPFFIAPVLPGETMRKALTMWRAVSDPLKSPLLGAHYQTFLFYVKHRDLDGRDDFANMMLDPTQSLAAYAQAANVQYYHSGAGISWVQQCLNRVVDWYFREGDEVAGDHKFTTLPIAALTDKSAWDSAINQADRTALADVNVDLNADSTITVSEIDKAMYTWQLLRTQGMTNMTYEDWLASNGVRPSQADLHKPELIRMDSDWQYPVNHIDPSDGSPSSAWVWRRTLEADKDRFFSEPGFVIGVMCVRPKVYLSGQKSTFSDLMTTLYQWMPAVLRDDVQASYKEIAAFSADVFGGNGTSTGNADGVWVDLKDLLLYGEQFVNFDLSATDAGLVALPTAALQKRFVSSTDADGLFAAASPANQIRVDGLTSLSIATTVEETSQRV